MATITQLREAGHTALLAGGCVRDMLLQRTPKDYDVATDAPPERVLALFPRARKVGVQFGVVLIRRFGHDIEVATFRSDGRYSDGRRPDEVTFGDARQDALRRDFTINGLFYDPIDERVIDYVRGREDLDAKVIRTIGHPALRFGEDHLRMLRAVRFAAVLQFTIEKQTFEAIRAHAPKLAIISPERVWMELAAMLTHSSRAGSWATLVTTELCDHLVASWRPDPKTRALIGHRLAALPATSIDPVVGLAAIVCDGGERIAARVARSLRLSNRQQGATSWLVRSLHYLNHTPQVPLADLKIMMAHDQWSHELALWRADLSARGTTDAPLCAIIQRADRIEPEDVTPPPLLTGDDLKVLGVKPGARFGTIIKTVYRAQLNEEIHTVEDARRLAAVLIDSAK